MPLQYFKRLLECTISPFSLFAELCSTLGSYLSHTWRCNRYMWGFCIWKYFCSSV